MECGGGFVLGPDAPRATLARPPCRVPPQNRAHRKAARGRWRAVPPPSPSIETSQRLPLAEPHPALPSPLSPPQALEAGGVAPYGQRITVLRCFVQQCRDAQLMVDLFVNYDCDLNSTNLFEKAVGVLLRIAQTGAGADAERFTPQQDATLRGTSIRALAELAASLSGWIDAKEAAAEAARAAEADAAEGEAAAAEAAAEGKLAQALAIGRKKSVGSLQELSEAERFEAARTAKVLFTEGLSLFNKKPKKGLVFLQKAGQLGTAPEEVALFLKHTPGLDKTQIGEILGSNEVDDKQVMAAYVDSIDFPDMELDDALRLFLSGFRLPGEAQKIDRLMEKFAERFCRVNPGTFRNADTAYVLSYSVIMLNTDLHNPMVKQKMTKAEFLKNNRGIDDGNDMPEELMGGLYDRILRSEIKMKDFSARRELLWGAAAAGTVRACFAACVVWAGVAGLRCRVRLVLRRPRRRSLAPRLRSHSLSPDFRPSLSPPLANRRHPRGRRRGQWRRQGGPWRQARRESRGHFRQHEQARDAAVHESHSWPQGRGGGRHE